MINAANSITISNRLKPIWKITFKFDHIIIVINYNIILLYQHITQIYYHAYAVVYV